MIFAPWVRNYNAAEKSETAIRLMFTGWCVIAAVFVNSYSSCLTSYLLTNHYTPMINSIEDIFPIPRPVFMVPKYSSSDASFLVKII